MLLTQIILFIYALFSLFKTSEILVLFPLFHRFILLILHVLKSFYHMAPLLWKRLPTDLRIRLQCLMGNSSPSHFASMGNSSPSHFASMGNSPPSLFASSPSQSHAKLKSYSSIIFSCLTSFFHWMDSSGFRHSLGFFVSCVIFVHSFYHATLIAFHLILPTVS
jgi:hypothetical protein